MAAGRLLLGNKQTANNMCSNEILWLVYSHKA